MHFVLYNEYKKSILKMICCGFKAKQQSRISSEHVQTQFEDLTLKNLYFIIKIFFSVD